jgi:hypothetical protein
MKFNDLLNSYINEEEQQPLNPGASQLKAYFTRKLNTPEGRESVTDMLVDIFTESETNIIAAVEEHYQTIRNEYRSLQQRNAPLGRAAVARKAQAEQPPIEQQ